MTCRDFEPLWNELLDGRDFPPPWIEQILEDHASHCPGCAPVHLRYRALRAALGVRSSPVVSPGFARRVLTPKRDPVRPSGRGAILLRWAVAASLAGVVIGLTLARQARPLQVEDRERRSDAADGTLGDALADATSATLDLARATSAPAGRVGRVVIASALSSPTAGPLGIPEVSAGSTSAILRSVGDRVGAGARPLSGSAWKAFGFLLETGSAGPDGPGASPGGRSPRDG